MASFQQYTTKKGEKLWRFQAYAGIDLKTGVRKKVQKRGFKTKKAAKLEGTVPCQVYTLNNKN